MLTERLQHLHQVWTRRVEITESESELKFKLRKLRYKQAAIRLVKTTLGTIF